MYLHDREKNFLALSLINIGVLFIKNLNLLLRLPFPLSPGLSAGTAAGITFFITLVLTAVITAFVMLLIFYLFLRKGSSSLPTAQPPSSDTTSTSQENGNGVKSKSIRYGPTFAQVGEEPVSAAKESPHYFNQSYASTAPSQKPSAPPRSQPNRPAVPIRPKC